jgi:transcriptional regulator with PAS, ATPase and Fis domain
MRNSRYYLLPSVEEGTFMAALYYRLNVISLDLT